MSFSGRNAVVTGAGGGMGLNIALDLLAEGAAVTLIDLKDAPAAISSFGAQALYRQGDVTDEAFLRGALEETFRRHGRLDHLVNAAGVLWFGRDKSLVEIDLAIWDQVIDIDLKSMMLCARHAVPLMKQTGPAKAEAGGSMVHISSIQALRGDDAPQDAYQAAKAGMIALSKSLAIQFAGDGIRSNCVLPGGTRSPMQERWDADPELQSAAVKGVPLGRLGTTQDMANAVLFLLSDEASYITGTELVVDGGRMALP